LLYSGANNYQDDLAAFHQAHFSSISIDHFTHHFLGSVDEEAGEDDGLGYYEDGVKRTLTDEQVAMFRHSEIQALRREQRHAEEAKEDAKLTPTPTEAIKDFVENKSQSSTPSAMPKPSDDSRNDSQERVGKGKKGKKGKGYYKQNVKPDLRKRTWDKVESGLESLEYGEESSEPQARMLASGGRRTISYDDV